MTPQQIALVQQTFGSLHPIARDAAGRFYAGLFTLDPSLRSLFPDDLTRQSDLLMQMLAGAVACLGRLERVVPTLEALGARHVEYGVEPRHYDLVGRALLDTLKEGLGSAFTPEVREAWAAAYAILAETMQTGAGKARKRAAPPIPIGKECSII